MDFNKLNSATTSPTANEANEGLISVIKKRKLEPQQLSNHLAPQAKRLLRNFVCKSGQDRSKSHLLARTNAVRHTCIRTDGRIQISNDQ